MSWGLRAIIKELEDKNEKLKQLLIRTNEYCDHRDWCPRSEENYTPKKECNCGLAEFYKDYDDAFKS